MSESTSTEEELINSDEATVSEQPRKCLRRNNVYKIDSFLFFVLKTNSLLFFALQDTSIGVVSIFTQIQM